MPEIIFSVTDLENMATDPPIINNLDSHIESGSKESESQAITEVYKVAGERNSPPMTTEAIKRLITAVILYSPEDELVETIKMARRRTIWTTALNWFEHRLPDTYAMDLRT